MAPAKTPASEESQLSTMRFDPRFPYTNQTYACHKNYCDYYRCRRLLGAEEEDCNLFKKNFTTLCPNFWIEKWDDQRAKGCFAGKLCLENIYWNCCEERFCFDEKIASYRLENADASYQNGYVNMGASLDNIITEQPGNNNHLPQDAVINGQANLGPGRQASNVPERVANGSIQREISEIPVNADKIYEVFSKSMIFREEHELNSPLGSSENLDEVETKSEPDYLSDKPNRTKVYFEDEINSPITDFEIMFKDELFGFDRNAMFKIEEEEDDDCEKFSKDDDGLTMNIVEVKKPGHDIVKPSSITIKEQDKITTQHPVYEYDPTKSVTMPSTVIPRNENVRSILRVNSSNKDLPRSHSDKSLTRVDSTAAMKSGQKLTRVESLKNMETKHMNRVLARVPHRSASFLNLPEHLTPEHKPIRKSDSAFAIRTSNDFELSLVSHLPDTPIIKSANLPKFFAESPVLGEYKGDTSLQSIKQKTDLIFSGNDYSMPRYYSKFTSPVEPVPVHESKSMPDLRSPSTSSGKVSKRLVKIRSKLKPLVIKKGADEKL